MTITASDITDDPAEVRIRIDAGRTSRVLTWSFERNPPKRATNYAEVASVALLPYAQREGSELRIEGSVSSSLLANLEDYRDYWNNVAPDRFDRISIVPEVIDDNVDPVDETTAVLAISGGVHSTYALATSHRTIGDERSRSIVSAVFIRDFDIATNGATEVARCSAICEAYDTPLSVVSTNWHEEFAHHDFSLSFLAGIAATLRLFAPDAGQGIVAASTTYGSVERPSGSNPSSNAFLGDLRFPIRSAGFGIDRPTKLQAIESLPRPSEVRT
ncbi:MAG: hypothetical protein M3132_01540 [Actinomycetia bacterium]|nr:hypothetical protein [Actinomycetes bacterium]